MGFWNGGIRSPSRSRSRSNSPTRRQSTASHKTHYTSKPSFTRSASSLFDGGANQPRGVSPSPSHRPRPSTTAGSRSYTSARPRHGFVARVRRFLRQIYEYMRRHPVKVFMLVIMPLITGGVLTKLLATVGIRFPRSVEQMLGSRMDRGQGQRYYARGGARDLGAGTALPGMGGGIGDSVQAAMSIAKMFL